MKPTALVFCLAALGALPLAAAAEEPVIPDDEFVYCTVCHGVQVGGNPVLAAPRLSSLSGWYVERQLRAFKKGWRGTHEDDDAGQDMRPMAAILSDEDIERAADYVDAVTSPPPPVTVEGDARRGTALYETCVACHGEDGEGDDALASPALAGQNDWYLLAQLRNFKSGVRGSDPKDTYGLQMRATMDLLPDEQAMKDVVRYISTLGDP